MGFGSVVFGFAAGALSILSPCVLPLVPLVLGSAVAAHRFGALALSAGLVVSFTGIGLFVATLGFAVGLDGDAVRYVAAALLGLMGLVLVSGALQQRVALATGGVGDVGHRLLSRLTPSGLSGQFLIGVILGAVWSPCVGPTLGAAWALASLGQDLGAVAAVMLAFGIGAALPLAVVGSLSRQALIRWRGRMQGFGQGGKYLLGAGSMAIAALILTGADHVVETWIVFHTPDWIGDLSTRF